MSDQIQCPACGTKIVISQALSDQVKKEYQTKIDLLQKQKQEEQEKFNKQTEKLKEEFNQKQKEQEQKLKQELWQKAQQKAQEKINLELKDMQARIEEDEKRKKEMEEEILAQRKQMREAQEDLKKEKIEIEKKLEEEKQKIEERASLQAQQKAQEEHRLKDLEKEKKISDLVKQLEEAKRKAQQGSQQNQGEVLELDLEKQLKEKFIYDLIEPIGKGVNGADIIQTVRNKTGKSCGQILYEVKQTKRWTEGWIGKLKDDLRKARANMAVLVSVVLPDKIEGFGLYQGIWVVSPKYLLALVVSLRKTLIEVAFERSAAEGKGGKAELLYNYVSSFEFRQKVEALVEIYQDMSEQITKEKLAFEKSWSQREKQLQRLLFNTASMYGDMQGLAGSAMGEIKGLEIGDEEHKKLTSNNKAEQTLF